MKVVKRSIKGLLSRFGYRLAPLVEAPSQEAVNLRHLAAAYEYLLNSVSPNDPIPTNETRILLLDRLLGTPPPKAYAIAQSLVRTAAVMGDVCEFGVAQGETSAFIANEILESSRKLHLFDSFEGLPAPSARDVLKDDIFELGSIEAYAGTMACPEELVVARLAAVDFPVDRYTIHRGFIESVIGTDSFLPRAVSFAFVDFDFYEPIKVALEFLDRVLQSGGIVVVDEYDFFSTGSKTAVDEFIRQANAEDQRYALEIPDPRLGYFAVLTRIR
jgi:hypothetical protein